MPETNRELVSRVLRDFEEDSKHHDFWCAKVDSWYRAYRGVLERASEAAGWRSQLHPPYILQIMETLVAGVLDPNPKWRVKPRRRMGGDPAALREGAKALEILLTAQRDQDMMIAKQRAHRLQGLIAGKTAWKTYWTLEERLVKKTQSVIQPDEFGYVSLVEEEFEVAEPTTDDPSVEVVDVRDLIVEESARDLASARRLTHRVWMTLDDLEKLQREGVYSNVSDLGKRQEGSSYADALSSRESDLFQVDRTKDRIEVLECWIEGGERVVTIADRNVLLADRKNPFEHGKYPFIVTAPTPDLFRMEGISVVELVQDLQEMLWTLQNQRLDATELLNNLILKVREGSTFEDPVFAPGEQWLMDDLTAVEPLELPQFPAQVSLQAEALIKADIQNIPGASPALLGQAERSEQTATEVSLLTNLAQRRLAAQKFQFTLADKQVAEQWIELNRQFLTEERYVAIVGEDGEEGWELIKPETFAPYEWRIEIEQMDEAMLRQERLAEAQARFQVAVAAVPVMAAIGQPLNMKAFLEDYLDAAGVTDPEKYLSAQPQMVPPAPGAPSSPGAPSPEGAAMTAPQAYDANSPSNAFSMSPVADQQRMGAMAGGAANA